MHIETYVCRGISWHLVEMNIMWNEYHMKWICCEMNILLEEHHVKWISYEMNILRDEYLVRWISCEMNIIWNEYHMKWISCEMNILWDEYHDMLLRWKHRSLLQKSPIKETIFCKRDTCAIKETILYHDMLLSATRRKTCWDELRWVNTSQDHLDFKITCWVRPLSLYLKMHI